MDVSHKVAVVTGGGRGIGRGICLVLAKNGADIVVADIVLEGAKGVADEIASMGRGSLATPLDVTDKSSIDAMVKGVLDKFGRIDILVNNAGIIGAPGWEDRQVSSDEDWDLLYDVNVKGIAMVTESVAEHMKERRSGKIINISSVAGREGSPFHAPYCVSKAGVISLTQSSARQLGPYNINVNAICPGLIWTPMWEKIAYRRSVATGNKEGLSPREVFDRSIRGTPLDREQTPEDMGNVAAFLASEYAKNITGQAINVDGGSRMN